MDRVAATKTDESDEMTMKELEQVRLLLLDVDGVLTDGRVLYGSDGQEFKAFHTRDGLGLRLLQNAGIGLGLVSGRKSDAVRRRAAELNIRWVYMGVRNKASIVEDIALESGIPLEHMAFVGDDLVDLPPMARVGTPIAVADAADEVKAAAVWVTRSEGGRGAVREIAESILKSQDRWADTLRLFQ